MHVSQASEYSRAARDRTVDPSPADRGAKVSSPQVPRATTMIILEDLSGHSVDRCSNNMQGHSTPLRDSERCASPHPVDRNAQRQFRQLLLLYRDALSRTRVCCNLWVWRRAWRPRCPRTGMSGLDCPRSLPRGSHDTRSSVEEALDYGVARHMH